MALYDLTPVEFALLASLLRAETPLKLEELAALVDRDKSTVSRSLQKMEASGVCTREVRNLKGGGYFYLYSANDLKTIKKHARQKIRELHISLDRILRRFEDDLNLVINRERMRILVAEDERDSWMSYKRALECRNHEVVIAENGIQCMNIYREEWREKRSEIDASPFDVILLDYRMPRMNGMEAAKQILRLNPRQRIIFVSAYVKETLVELARELDSAVELMQKPFDAITLVETVEDRSTKVELEKLWKRNAIWKGGISEKGVIELFESIRRIHKGRTF